jgi:hypothetical protein
MAILMVLLIFKKEFSSYLFYLVIFFDCKKVIGFSVGAKTTLQRRMRLAAFVRDAVRLTYRQADNRDLSLSGAAD